MVDPIHGDILGAKITSNDGVERHDNKQIEPGAKDSLSTGTNVTEPFSTSFSVPGPYGGMKTAK